MSEKYEAESAVFLPIPAIGPKSTLGDLKCALASRFGESSQVSISSAGPESDWQISILSCGRQVKSLSQSGKLDLPEAVKALLAPDA